MNFDSKTAQQLEAIIKHRRTVKPHSFTGAGIPHATVEKILASANWAPNHGKTEPWRFKVYSGTGKKMLLEILKKLYLETTPKDKVRPEKLEKIEVNCTQSSHVIVISMKRQEIERIPEIEEVEAVACAVQNIALTATAHNVCGYWSSGKITYTEEAKLAFGLGKKDLLLGFYYLGLPAIEIPEGKRCSSIDEKIEWIKE